MTHVRLSNPETGGVWDCPADVVDVYKARGWEETDKALPEELIDTTTDFQASDFDPADHTVAEVNEHLANSDPNEVERVLGLEASGKNRSSIAAPKPTQPEGVSLNG